MKFHHIGICCKNIEKEIKKIAQFHKINSISNILYDKNQEVSLCMVNIENGLNLELVSGKKIESLIQKKVNYYHICYEVEDLKKEKENLIKNGAFLISDEKEAILFDNKKVCFLLLSYGLIELVERL